MFSTISIKNFRGIESLGIERLGSFNLITGKNGSGKTTLLEVPFLLGGAGNPALPLSLNSFRGESLYVPGSQRPFRSLFRNLSASAGPELSGEWKSEGVNGKRGIYKLRVSPILSPGTSGTTYAVDKIEGLSFLFKGPSEERNSSVRWAYPESMSTKSTDSSERAVAGPGMQLVLDPPRFQTSGDFLEISFVSPYWGDAWLNAHRLVSQLTLEGRIAEVVERLHVIDRRLKNLVAISDEDGPMVYADIGQKRLHPVSILGAGFTSVMNLYLTLVRNRDAVVLIDELEDGIHYSLLNEISRQILSIVRDLNLQVFATTHSAEALFALSKCVSQSDWNEYQVLRIQQDLDSGMRVVRFRASDVVEGDEIGVEVR